jgi:hypothetical protein
MAAAVFAVAGVPPPSSQAAAPATLAALLGLRTSESPWLSVLTQAERHELRQALASADDGPVAPRTIELLGKLISRRSRLYAFLGYPQAADVRSVCDGLVRE